MTTRIGLFNYTNEESEQMQVTAHSSFIIATLAILYSTIFAIGIIGNSLVVYVVCAKKNMQSVTNLFIMNLALSDILMDLLAVPFTPIAYFQEEWKLGKYLCHLVNYSLGVSVYVSTLTSLAIAIDRYFVIVHPFKPRMKLGVCVLLIIVVWIVSLSISLPLLIYMELVNINENGTEVIKCKESWPIPMSKRFYDLASLVLQYLMPFTLITYSYAKVWYILSKHTRPGKSKEKEEMDLKRKKRTNRMLVAMVLIFAICWMPLNTVFLIIEFSPDLLTSFFSTVFFSAHVIAMSSTIYNPFLYAWLNENFRKEFRLILPWVFTFFRWCNSFGKKKSKNNGNNNDLNDESSKLFNRPEVTEMSVIQKSIKNKRSVKMTEEINGATAYSIKVSPNELNEVLHEEEEKPQDDSKKYFQSINNIELIDSNV